MAGDSRFSDDDELWDVMYNMDEAELANHPAPYTWIAVLLYAADYGWGLNPQLTAEEYETGVNLWQYDARLTTFQMQPYQEPVGGQLPANVDAPGGSA